MDIGDNSYECVAEHNRSAHKRDVAFGVVMAIVTVFALGSLRFASKRVAETPMARACIVGNNC